MDNLLPQMIRHALTHSFEIKFLRRIFVCSTLKDIYSFQLEQMCLVNGICCPSSSTLLPKHVWYLLLWLLFWLATISILSVSYLFADLIVLSSSNLENPFEVVTGSMYHPCYLRRTDMLTTIVPACAETVESLFLHCNEVQNCCLCYGAVFLLL